MLNVTKIVPLKLVIKDVHGFLEQSKCQGDEAYIQALKVVEKGTIIIKHVVSFNGVTLYDTGIQHENGNVGGTIGLLLNELKYFTIEVIL